MLFVVMVISVLSHTFAYTTPTNLFFTLLLCTIETLSNQQKTKELKNVKINAKQTKIHFSLCRIRNQISQHGISSLFKINSKIKLSSA